MCVCMSNFVPYTKTLKRMGVNELIFYMQLRYILT